MVLVHHSAGFGIEVSNTVMIRVLISKEKPDSWDEFLCDSGNEASLYQSYFWAIVVEKICKAVPYFLTVSDNNSTLGQALVIKRWPFDRNTEKKQFPLPYLECIEGPTVPCDSRSCIYEILIQSIIKLAHKNLATYISITESVTNQQRYNEGIVDLFLRYDFSRQICGSYLVDIEKEENELFMGLKNAARKCIKKCKRLGVFVEKIKTIDEFREVYWRTYVESENQQGRSANPFSPIEWENDVNGYCHYYISRDENNDILACLGMCCFNGIAKEIASTLTPKAHDQKVPAQDLLHWELMLEAKRMGCHTFDLAGVKPNPLDSKEIGIKRFKKKWGGKYVEFNKYRRYSLRIMELAIPLMTKVYKRLKKQD